MTVIVDYTGKIWSKNKFEELEKKSVIFMKYQSKITDLFNKMLLIFNFKIII